MAPPGYREIADDLRHKIETREYAPGTLLPDRAELLTAYSTSTATLSAAIRVLTDEGYVSRNAPRGRLVVLDQRPIDVNLTLAPRGGGLGPWEVTCRNAGRDGQMRLISVTEVPADRDAALALQLSPGATVVRRVRHALLDGQVVMLDTAHYPAELVERTPIAGTGKVPGGVLGALAATHLLDPDTARVRHLIWSRPPSKDEAETLRLRPGTSVLSAQRIVYNDEARPVELLQRVANERRVRFETYGLRLT